MLHTHILLELVNKFNKVAGYKINIQKSFVFLNTSDKQPKNEIRKPSYSQKHQK